MNIDTGKLRSFSDEESMREAMQSEPFIPVDASLMTEKQKSTMQVSLKDHRSPLGKQLTKNRKRNLRRKGLLR